MEANSEEDGTLFAAPVKVGASAGMGFDSCRAAAGFAAAAAMTIETID